MRCGVGPVSPASGEELGSRTAEGRQGRRVSCCFVLSSGPVCAAAGRPPRPGEPNQCWIWRWCLSALWETSNGNSRWVSVGSSLRALFSRSYFPPGPSRLWSLLIAPQCPRLVASSVLLAFGAPGTRYRLRPARPARLWLSWALTPSPQALTGPLPGLGR